MTELYINQKLNQLVELDLDDMPNNPLADVDDIKGLFDLGLLGGKLKDWKEAMEQVHTSYTLA